VVDRAAGKTEHRRFSDLPEYLDAGDVLVFNDSRVIKARLIGNKKETGARIEILLLRHTEGERRETGRPDARYGAVWEALAKPAKRLKAGDRVLFGAGLVCEVIEKTGDGFLILGFECEGDFEKSLERLGHVPLPPYIRRGDEDIDAVRYQTVYAKTPGSIAAPTAGLHFTDGMLDMLRGKGVETVFVTLHVGPGTFRPVQTESIEDHKMHEEYYSIGEGARLCVNRAKKEKRRIICVGTTSVRTLESACAKDREGGFHIPEQNRAGDTDIYIYPGGRGIAMADGLITNFHLPKSTLLMLVSAFYDREKILAVYKEAVDMRYRFFSYGDAMLIL